MDVILELGGDAGVLIFTATIIGLLFLLRQRAKRAYKSLPLGSPVIPM